jgi:hypothetical protein
VAFNASRLESCHIISVPSVRIRTPRGVGREIGDLDQGFAWSAKGLSEGPKIYPLEVGFSEVVYRMIKVETVDITADPHSQSRKIERPARVLACPIGRTYRGEE